MPYRLYREVAGDVEPVAAGEPRRLDALAAVRKSRVAASTAGLASALRPASSKSVAPYDHTWVA